MFHLPESLCGFFEPWREWSSGLSRTANVGGRFDALDRRWAVPL